MVTCFLHNWQSGCFRQQSIHLLNIYERLSGFFKWANPGLFFVYFGLFKQTLQIFTTNICEKMSIQYTVPGFEPMTFRMQVSSRNH